MTIPTGQTQTAAQPLLRLERTGVRIAGERVLEPIDWSLEAGTHWGIVGANGSGKSTFLRLIAGTLWPAPGEGRRTYDFGGGPLTDAVEARQRVSLVSHELQNLYARRGWNFRALDVVRSGVTRTDIPRRNPSARDVESAGTILARLGIAHLAERRFLELSRGEQRRVLIARAMAYEPEILLLDEPASGLDAFARTHLDRTLAALADTTTIVCTAHRADELPSVASRILELEAGRAVERPASRSGHAPRLAPGAQDVATTGESRGPAAPARAPATESAPETRRRPPPSAAQSATGPAGTGNLIEIDRASVFIGQRAILREASWRLGPGENWLVTGPNGAGKSTFLRLLHGQVRPAVGGSIRWPALGNPRSVWTLRRRIGYVSAELQAAYRYAATVTECIASGFDSSIGLVKRLSRDEQDRVEELLGAFALEKLGGRSLTTLSYGQMHRVLIARTLASAPGLLLLDEPWEGLDRATRDLVLRRLVEFMAGGGQIVCVSHVAEAGLEFSHRLSIAAGQLSSDDAGA